MFTDKTSGANIPVWLDKHIKDEPRPQYSPLKNNISTEVTIVGAGIAGLATAYMLSKMGTKVVILEDGEIASGETGRTTAHLMSEVDDKYYQIAKTHGKEAAKLVAESHSQAIDMIEEICASESIEAEFERCFGYLFLSAKERKRNDTSILEKEFAASNEAGMESTMVSSIPELKYDFGPALKFTNQGHVNPIKFLNGLAKACTKRGVKIYTHTHAQKVAGGNPAEVVTSDGCTVVSDYIVMCTNVPVNDRFTMYTKMVPHRTYVIAATIPKGSVPNHLYWDTEEPYHYVRIAKGDDESTELLIVGGEDHIVGRKHDYEERFRALTEWTRDRFPQIIQVVSKWSGQVNEPVDLLAFLGPNPGDHPNVLIHTGDSGTGMTYGMIGAKINSDKIMGLSNRWAKLYDPSRLMTREPTEFITENIHTQLQYKSWFTGSDVNDMEDIAKGEGAVIRKGLSKVAVYRDDDGELHTRSAVCTHLGGIVNWNCSEKCWECPVHGSRFDPFGRVVNGPANTPLSGAEKETIPSEDVPPQTVGLN